MWLDALDPAPVARGLALLGDRDGDWTDALFERREEIEITGEGAPGIRVRREEGLAVRLVRDGRTWLVTRDEVSSAAFLEALRQAARTSPRTPLPDPKLGLEPWPDHTPSPELLELPTRLSRVLRRHHVAFPFDLVARSIRRELRVVGPRFSPEPEVEELVSLEIGLPWGRWGALMTELSDAVLERVGRELVDGFRARSAPSATGRMAVVLGPSAAGVFVHEAVAHALEADTLALTGRPEAALAMVLAAPVLSVLDDPGSAPEGVARRTDDEGHAVIRRWLLRDGRVEQILADQWWAGDSARLQSGAGRRASRHVAPAPRCSHLEILPGTASESELFSGAGEGLFLPFAERGRLDPLSGRFELVCPFGWWIRRGEIAEAAGRCRVSGYLARLLGRIIAVGKDRRVGGAGWCAKGDQKLPVWATCPSLLVSEVDVDAP